MHIAILNLGFAQLRGWWVTERVLQSCSIMVGCNPKIKKVTREFCPYFFSISLVDIVIVAEKTLRSSFQWNLPSMIFLRSPLSRLFPCMNLIHFVRWVHYRRGYFVQKMPLGRLIRGRSMQMLHDLHKKDTESSPPSITSVGQNMPHYNLIMPFTKSPREFKNPKPSLGALISPFEMSYMSSTVIR